MAKALGSAVFAGSVKEIGWGQIQLTTQGSEPCLQPLSDAGAVVLHWHGDTFDLPSGALRLASNASYENQAFSYGRNAMGLQFHLEADPRQLEEWNVGHAVELAAVGVSIKDLRAATAKLAEQLPARANAIFTRWLQEID
jgi:GMP synthase (glutamine-hydrolysing)